MTRESERRRLNKIAPWENKLDICPFCDKPVEMREIHTQKGFVWGSECCFVGIDILDNLGVFQGLPRNVQQAALERSRAELTYINKMHMLPRGEPVEWIEEFMASLEDEGARNKAGRA